MNALLITFNKYPDDAGGMRIHMFAKILHESGYCVHVISMGETTNMKMLKDSDGIQHISFRGAHTNKFCKSLYYILFPIRLTKMLLRTQYNVIIHTQIDEISLRILQLYGKKKNIPIVYDSVEWYSPSQFTNKTKSKAYRLNNKYNTKLINRWSKVIAISSYLEQSFIQRGIPSIRIPVIVDTQEIQYHKAPKDNDDIITIIYAGNPGLKDYLKDIIIAIDTLSAEERCKIHFTIIGCTAEELVKVCLVDSKILNRNLDVISVYGRIPKKDVLKEYSYADYSILIRDHEARYAKAGFPTKFVESLALGSPVICNISSDLGQYAKDDYNSIVIRDSSPESICEGLRRVISYSKEKRLMMQSEARESAIDFFDYHHFSKDLISFIS